MHCYTYIGEDSKLVISGLFSCGSVMNYKYWNNEKCWWVINPDRATKYPNLEAAIADMDKPKKHQPNYVSPLPLRINEIKTIEYEVYKEGTK